MKLRSLELAQFRKFERRVRIPHLADGLNVLCGANEFGKSTLLAAIRGVLFERHGSRAESVRGMQHHRNNTSPVIALSFELEGGLYQVEKRFLHRDPYARLVLPDGTRVEGEAAEETLQSLLGFRPSGNRGARPEDAGMWAALWVTQRQSCDQPALPDAARTALQSCLEAEIGVMTGGARGQALLGDVREELGRLLDARDKPRGRMKELGEQLAAAEAGIVSLTEKRRALEDDLRALQRCGRELAIANDADEAARLEADLADARRRRETVLRYEDKRTQAITELRLAEGKHTDALGETARRTTRAASLNAARSLLCRANGEQAAAREDLDRTEAALAERQAALDAMQREADAATLRLRAARQVAALAVRAAEAEALAARLGRAETAQAAVNARLCELAAMRIDAAAVQAVHGAAREVLRSQAVLDAQATLIELEIEPDAAGRIEVDGAAAGVGRTTLRAVTDVAVVIPGIGHLAIRPAIRDRATLQAAIAEAERKLAEKLSEAGASDAADAERRLALRTECERQLKLARAELAAHAPADRAQGLAAGAEALRHHLATTRRRLEADMAELGLAELPSPDDAAAAERKVATDEAAAADALLPARAALAVSAAERTDCAGALARVEANRDAAAADLTRLLRETEYAAARETDDALAARLLSAAETVERQRAVVSALEADRPQDTLTSMDARIRRFEEAIGQRRETRQRLQRDKAVLQSRIQQAEGGGIDEQIAIAERRRDDLRLDRDSLQREADALILLRDTLIKAEREAKERYLAPVVQRMTPYLRGLFPGAVVSCDDNFRITGLTRTGQALEEFERLSDGTQEQVAILSRLAFADVLIDRGRPAMVILDDALAYADGDRIERMFDLLAEAATRMQILVLTCRTELFTRLGGHRLELVADSYATSEA